MYDGLRETIGVYSVETVAQDFLDLGVYIKVVVHVDWWWE